MFARYTRVANWTLSAALAVAKTRNAVAKNRTAESSSDGYEAAAVLLRQAVAEQTSWAYDEPPAWHMPMRQCARHQSQPLLRVCSDLLIRN